MIRYASSSATLLLFCVLFVNILGAGYLINWLAVLFGQIVLRCTIVQSYLDLALTSCCALRPVYLTAMHVFVCTYHRYKTLCSNARWLSHLVSCDLAKQQPAIQGMLKSDIRWCCWNWTAVFGAVARHEGNWAGRCPDHSSNHDSADMHAARQQAARHQHIIWLLAPCLLSCDCCQTCLISCIFVRHTTLAHAKTFLCRAIHIIAKFGAGLASVKSK